MDHLFSPWRFSYVSNPKEEAERCVFCRLGSSNPDDDTTNYILHRGNHHYLVLNIYPYNPGHLMVVPYEHHARLGDMEPDALAELLALTCRVERLLDDTYAPEGINVGLNIGRCAGAGIVDHLHLHAVPRWTGDTSFMTVTGGTRVLPEDLAESWLKLRRGLEEGTGS